MTRTPRLLPQFIILGAMKCGTTTLYRYLCEHPEVEMSRDKETDYFVAEKEWPLGPDWYSRQWTGRTQVRGEASPNYTKRRDFPGVPERIAATCPDVRLVYIVRDPVARCESQFRHGVIHGALDVDLEDFADSHEYRHILDASMYALQLDAYRAHFPSGAILVLDFDDLVRDPQSVMDALCAHIGVSPMAIVDAGARNDSRELARIPGPLLRLIQSRWGQRLAGTFGRDARDRIKKLLARGKPRQAVKFSEPLLARLRSDLADDAARFRTMTGKRFENWTV